jgi:hypothetical protein
VDHAVGSIQGHSARSGLVPASAGCEHVQGRRRYRLSFSPKCLPRRNPQRVLQQFNLFAGDVRPAGVVADNGDDRNAVAHKGTKLGKATRQRASRLLSSPSGKVSFLTIADEPGRGFGVFRRCSEP